MKSQRPMTGRGRGMKAEVEKPCVKCGSNVFYVYVKARRCVACSNQQSQSLRKKVQALEATIKSIHTWARFDIKAGGQFALIPKDVVKLCRKHI